MKKVIVVVLSIFMIVGCSLLSSGPTKKTEEFFKKYQNLVVKKILTGVLVFLIPYLVEFIFGFFDNTGVIKCVMSLLKYQ